MRNIKIITIGAVLSLFGFGFISVQAQEPAAMSDADYIVVEEDFVAEPMTTSSENMQKNNKLSDKPDLSSAQHNNMKDNQSTANNQKANFTDSQNNKNN